MSSSGNRDTEAGSSPNGQENTERHNGFKTKSTKKVSRSACDLRVTRDSSPYMVTGAFDTQRQTLEFLTGRIHSHPNLERQESSRNVSLDTTRLCQPQSLKCHKLPQNPLNRLADILFNLQKKPQSITIRTVTTTPKTFDGESEKFELFEVLFHTMIKMQPVMTE